MKRLYLPSQEWEQLLGGAAADRNQELLAIRDYAILSLFVATGIRCSELGSLNVGDLDPDGYLVTVRRGKGKKRRTAYGSEESFGDVDAYLDLRDPPAGPGDPLFLSRKGGRIARRTLYDVVRGAGLRAELGHTHPHQLRHSTGTAVLRETGNLKMVQKVLGHARIGTTERYTHIEDDEAAAAIEAISRRRRGE